MKETISPEELKKLLDKNGVLLIDVREPSEHFVEAIESSNLIPLGQLCCSRLPSKGKVIVTQCRFGKRSAEARRKLLQEDPSLEVYSLEGGITAWKEAGYPIITQSS